MYYTQQLAIWSHREKSKPAWVSQTKWEGKTILSKPYIITVFAYNVKTSMYFNIEEN